MSYRLAIFDFDGTLADSFPFFVAVFNQVADKHAFNRIHPEELDALRKLGAREIMSHIGMPRWKLPLVARTFMGLMKKHRSAIALFQDIADTLRHLDEQGLILAVVSSNSGTMSRKCWAPAVDISASSSAGLPFSARHRACVGSCANSPWRQSRSSISVTNLPMVKPPQRPVSPSARLPGATEPMKHSACFTTMSGLPR